VSNALVTYLETREHRERPAEQVKSAADAVRLARLHYATGNTSYLEVLTTGTDLYAAQLQLSQAQEQETSSLYNSTLHWARAGSDSVRLTTF